MRKNSGIFFTAGPGHPVLRENQGREKVLVACFTSCIDQTRLLSQTPPFLENTDLVKSSFQISQHVFVRPATSSFSLLPQHGCVFKNQ